MMIKWNMRTNLMKVKVMIIQGSAHPRIIEEVNNLANLGQKTMIKCAETKTIIQIMRNLNSILIARVKAGELQKLIKLKKDKNSKQEMIKSVKQILKKEVNIKKMMKMTIKAKMTLKIMILKINKQ